MKQFLLLILSSNIFFAACDFKEKARHSSYELKYTAYRWLLDDSTLTYRFYIHHAIAIDSDGSFKLCRKDSAGKNVFFSGYLDNSICKLIDSIKAQNNFKNYYLYYGDLQPIYCGLDYCIDFTKNNKRNIILFIPHKAPEILQKLNAKIDTLMYNNKNTRIDSFDFATYIHNLSDTIWNSDSVEKPPPPIKQTVRFIPPKL